MNEVQSSNDLTKDELMLAQNANVSMDILSWMLKILKYWYLFVITVILALGLAYLKNKAWTPTYKTGTNLLIQEARINTTRGDFTSGYQGLGMGMVNRSYTNQMIMYKSYDFVADVVDKMNMNYDTYNKLQFKDINLYNQSPVRIESTYIADQAYGLEFKIKGIDENSFSISYEGETKSYLDRILKRDVKLTPPFEVVANYDEPFQHSFFFLNVKKTDLYVSPSFEIYLKFYSKASLVSDYQSRLSTSLLLEGSSVVQISMLGKIAQRDLDFLTLLNEEFSNQNLDYKNRSAESSINFLDSQLSVIRDSIDSSESKLNTFQLNTGMYSQDVSLNKSQLAGDLEKQSADLRLKKEYMILLEKELSKTDGLLTDPSATGISTPQLSALVAQYNILVEEAKGLGPRNPHLATAQRRTEDAKTQIRNIIQTMNESYDVQREDLQSRLSKARGEVASMPQQERRLLTHERDFNINQTYYNYLLQRRLESQLQKASNSSDNIVIDNPRVLGLVNGGEKMNTYTLFLIIGLIIPLIFVICKEILFKFAIQTREELERISNLPVLGSIERSKWKEFLAVKNHPRSSFAEGFRSLRSRMEFAAKKERPVSMLVTSTEPRDGKTFIAVNMASIYHIATRKVVIVDFDLRRPMLTKSLGMENKQGLSSYLISKAGLDDIIYTHSELDIDVIPAGIIPPNPSELIRSDQTLELLKELYEKYDYVILDCSPVGLVADAHFLSRQVDVVLYVVRNEKTNRNFFKCTIQELREDGITNIALIYNDIDIQRGYYGSRRYYGKSSYHLKHGSYYSNDD